MLTLTAPKSPAEKYLHIFTGVVYVNALNLLPSNERYSHGAIELNVLIVHRKTGEERLISLLTPNDSFSTIQEIIRLEFPSRQWMFGESWEIEPEQVATAA